jgi:peptidoglycan hydrolase-like protein with peptidoglycan-binding domain
MRWRPALMITAAVLAATAFGSMPARGGIVFEAAPAPAAHPMRIAVDTPVEEMAPELRKAYVIGIQEELDSRGYRPGPPDGVMGPRTRESIRRYQHDAGLPVDGVATKELLDHMKFVVPELQRSQTAERSTPLPYDPLVLDVQRELYARGFYSDKLDGVDGPQTRGAVEAFQRQAGLPVTREVSVELLAQLRAAPASLRAN